MQTVGIGGGTSGAGGGKSKKDMEQMANSFGGSIAAPTTEQMNSQFMSHLSGAGEVMGGNLIAAEANKQRTMELNAIGNSINKLPANNFAFEPIKDQRRFAEAQLAGMNQRDAGTYANDATAVLSENIQQIDNMQLTPQQQAQEALMKPFNDPMGFIKDTFSPDTLKETLPLALGAAGAFEAVGNLIAGIGSKVLATRQLTAITKISQTLGISETRAGEIVAEKLASKSVTEAIRGISPKLFSKGIATSIIGVGGSVAGADVVFQWYALDNVIGGQKFYVKDIIGAMKNGDISYQDAADAIGKSREIRQVAINKVKLSASINPIMYPARKLMLEGVEADEQAIALLEAQVGL